MNKHYKYDFKPEFKERMQILLTNKEDFDNFEKIIHTPPKNFIRCNTIKITPENLFKNLKENWNVVQPYQTNPEIMLVEQNLLPGELGNSIEHLMGYYYIQEVCSMMSIIALSPKENEFIFDCCASPGSKTTQAAASMNNLGTILANDLKLDRIKILSSNLERCGVTNTLTTKDDAVSLCSKLSKNHSIPKFDKILLDAPCSGEGTLRSSPKTFLMWNQKIINKLSRQQKKLIAFALKTLKKNGEIVYSTCTHAPEENEEVIDFALKNFPVEIQEISLPLKTRPGLTKWLNKEYLKDIEKCHRIYPQDNDSEGFFVAKLKLLEEIK